MLAFWVVACGDESLPSQPTQLLPASKVSTAPTEFEDLGDITNLDAKQSPEYTIEGDGTVQHYRFSLTEAKQVQLGLQQQGADADLFLDDADGTELHSSTESGTTDEHNRRAAIGGHLLHSRGRAGGFTQRIQALLRRIRIELRCIIRRILPTRKVSANTDADP